MNSITESSTKSICNALGDCMSRIDSNAHATVYIDDDILCFLIEKISDDNIENFLISEMIFWIHTKRSKLSMYSVDKNPKTYSKSYAPLYRI